ncbi:MAG: potassium channel family protein [Methylacidiphilales bacterium]|nr:potassium channel family protein [Candidatus Methylacidiphilales bacterium]
MVSLLMISPIYGVYDQQDNVITPLMAIIFLAVIFGTAERKTTIVCLGGSTLLWAVIGFITPGSGLFSGPSLLAPLLFMVLLVAIFILLARWMVRTAHIDTEVLCAAICGYLLLGILWTGLYAAVERMRELTHHPDAFVSSTSSKLSIGDWLYFSYATLTTTGYGDISPRGSEVRMLAVLEAMVGVFYNTIVIARFVALYGFKARESGPHPSEDESP